MTAIYNNLTYAGHANPGRSGGMAKSGLEAPWNSAARAFEAALPGFSTDKGLTAATPGDHAASFTHPDNGLFDNVNPPATPIDLPDLPDGGVTSGMPRVEPSATDDGRYTNILVQQFPAL